MNHAAHLLLPSLRRTCFPLLEVGLLLAVSGQVGYEAASAVASLVSAGGEVQQLVFRILISWTDFPQ